MIIGKVLCLIKLYLGLVLFIKFVLRIEVIVFIVNGSLYNQDKGKNKSCNLMLFIVCVFLGLNV